MIQQLFYFIFASLSLFLVFCLFFTFSLHLFKEYSSQTYICHLKCSSASASLKRKYFKYNAILTETLLLKKKKHIAIFEFSHFIHVYNVGFSKSFKSSKENFVYIEIEFHHNINIIIYLIVVCMSMKCIKESPVNIQIDWENNDDVQIIQITTICICVYKYKQRFTLNKR